MEEKPGSQGGHSRSQQAGHRTASETDVRRITPHKRILLLQWTVTLPNRVRWLRACSGDWLRSASRVLVGSTEGTFFLSFFFLDLLRFISPHPNREVKRFTGVMLRLCCVSPCKRREVFGFASNRVISKTTTIRGEKLVCSSFYWIGSKTGSCLE